MLPDNHRAKALASSPLDLYNLGPRGREIIADFSKISVGEIDTRAPFQSVKAAVNLFGEVAAVHRSLPEKSKKGGPKIFAKDSKLHWARKEIILLKLKTLNAQNTKAQALIELGKARETVEELTAKLQSVNTLREFAVKATEAAKDQVKQLLVTSSNSNDEASSWKLELEGATEQYKATASELDAAKQDLINIQREYSESMNAKESALQRVEVAESVAKANKERVDELSVQIVALQESLKQVKLAASEAQNEEEKILQEKDAQLQSTKRVVEERERQLHLLRKDLGSGSGSNLEEELAKTYTDIRILEQEIENVKASAMDMLKNVNTNIDKATGALRKVEEEENSLKGIVESLKTELESIKKEHSELRKREAEAVSIAGNLHEKLKRSKNELEMTVSGESKARAESEELVMTLQKLASESEKAKKEVEELKIGVEDMKREATIATMFLEETGKRLQISLKEAEEAKAAEAVAVDQVKVLSKKTHASRVSQTGFDSQITISSKEYESLKRKVEESDKLAEIKVVALLAQIEAVKAGEDEAMKRLEATLKKIEEMNAATETALKQAEMAEAAKQALEGELMRLHEREQKQVTEAASPACAGTEMSSEPSSPFAGIAEILKPNMAVMDGNPKTVKSSSVKRVLMPSFSSMFHKKRVD